MSSLAGESVTAEPSRTSQPPGVLRQVWAILSPAERKRFLLLQPLVIFTALLETAGLASIVPFLALLSDPDAIEENASLKVVYDAVGFTSPTSFFFAVGVGVLLLVTVGNAVNAITTWSLLRFAWDGNHTMSLRLLESYLARPYAYFLEHNSSELAKNILAEVGIVVSGVLVVLTQMLARGVVLTGILLMLLVLDPLMAVGTGGVFGLLYGGMFAAVRQKLRRDGEMRNTANGARHKIAGEALGGVKELKLYGLEGEVARAYEKPSVVFGTTQARAAVIGQLPRYALESIAFGGVLLIVLGLLWRGQGLADVLPVLGLYAFSAYRMLPGLQTMFSGFTNIRFAQSALDTLYRDLHAERPAPLTSPSKIAFASTLALRDVTYSYPTARRVALNGVNLVIAKGQWVAFVGPTGAGKSTLVDLLLGLLVPDSGAVVVDGVPLDTARARAWQAHVAYVPQQIFLIDDTVARNICFGVDANEIDRVRMEQAARIAQIHDFIESELPNGYRTAIGERGVRLSGGQRQRIGIARALYRQPDFLVLDEATSALDNATEAAFLAALREDFAMVSVVSIAHRLTTTRDFDRIAVVEQGRIVDQGTFSELLERSPNFKDALAKAACDS